MRRLGMLALGLAGLLLAACGGSSHDADLSAEQAQHRYPAVMRELSTHLGPATWRVTGTATHQDNGSGCTWYAATLTSDTWLARDGNWSGPIAAANAVLVPHGFAKITGEDKGLKGGFTGFSAKDTHGARLRVMAKGRTSIELSVPVTDSCK